jgi:hypothetical protein
MSCITTATITAVGAAIAGVITAIAGWVRARAEKQRANAEVIRAQALYEKIVRKLKLRAYEPATLGGSFSWRTSSYRLPKTNEQLVNEWLEEAK